MRFSAGTSVVAALSSAAPRSAPTAAATLASAPKRPSTSTGAALRAATSASRTELECSRGCRSASSPGTGSSEDARRSGGGDDANPRLASVIAWDCAGVTPTRRNASRSSSSCLCWLCCCCCCSRMYARMRCSGVSRCHSALTSSASRDERRDNSGDAPSLPLEPLLQPPIRPPKPKAPEDTPSSPETGASGGVPEATISCWPCGR
mmetsp:Transcript_2485/g.9736  ORF Transcript_2485/g.9736 Transcript_2485/m.9736 type:complete len:206 (-) Transcript_2485:786-1403(-)